jgi:hypothetical protein
MKNHNLFYCLIFVLFSACTVSSNSTSQDEEDSTKATLAYEANIEKTEKITLPFIEDNFSQVVFPLQIDTVIFEGKKKLSSNFLIELDKMVKKDENRYSLQLNAYAKLSKLKGTEQEKIENGYFDIGDIVKLSYYDMGQTFLENKNVWLAFIGIDYQSYEACPWSNGREIVLCTFDKEGNLIDLTTIAENSEGGDPPVWGTGEKKVVSENGIVYSLSIKNVYGEYNDNGERDFEEIDKETQKISIQPNGQLKTEEPQNKK